MAEFDLNLFLLILCRLKYYFNLKFKNTCIFLISPQFPKDKSKIKLSLVCSCNWNHQKIALVNNVAT